MKLSDFRATCRKLSIAQAVAEFPHLSDLDTESYDGVFIYLDGAYILESRQGCYLELEGDEYLTRDKALLEFILWQWVCVNSDLLESNIARMIWG